ncbi:MAG: hypothetical protein LW688_12050 [Cryomorphaceae bacterium]|nr:hypothetical protein [Cryomorphaceae bacterium]
MSKEHERAFMAKETSEADIVFLSEDSEYCENDFYFYLVKIFLAAILLLCLIDWSYGYYLFVRFASTASFVYLAYAASQKNQSVAVAVFILLAILFQPFEKIALGRTLWNVVDVAVALGLIVSMLTDRKENK